MPKVTLVLYIATAIIVIYRVTTACPGGKESCKMETNSVFPQVQIFHNIREWAIDKTETSFPAPLSQLLLGMTLGVDKLKQTPAFHKMLQDTGTIHVVVVSGYNISLVFNIVIKLFGNKYRLSNLMPALILTFFYAVMSGFEPPVIRAWVMGSIIAGGRYYGMGMDTMKVIVFSAMLLLILWPDFVYSLSFQLSFAATLSLVVYSEKIDNFIKRATTLRGVLLDDLATTVSAQILVWPLIAHHFGRISLLSPFINAAILWTVPLSTVFGGLFFLISFTKVKFLINIISLFLTIPLEIFASFVELCSEISFVSIDFPLTSKQMMIYYVLLLIFQIKGRGSTCASK